MPLEIPVLAQGSWKFDFQSCYSATLLALKMGYRHIDCAYSYKNQKAVGNAIKDFLKINPDIKRSDLFITSKLGNSQQQKPTQAIKATLEELQLDYLDLYLIHWPVCFESRYGYKEWKLSSEPKYILPLDAYYPRKNTRSSTHKSEAPEDNSEIEDTGSKIKDPNSSEGCYAKVPFTKKHLSWLWKRMESFVSEGLTRHIGVSNFNLEQLKFLCDSFQIRPYCNQVEFHPMCQQVQLRKGLSEMGVRLVGFSSLGGASANLRENSKVLEVSKTLGISPCQTLLAWALFKGAVVISRGDKTQYLEENLSSLRLFETEGEEREIIKKELEKLDQLEENRTMIPMRNDEEKGTVVEWIDFFEKYVWDEEEDGIDYSYMEKDN